MQSSLFTTGIGRPPSTSALGTSRERAVVESGGPARGESMEDAADRDEEYLKVSQVAAILHVSPQTVSRWADEGKVGHLITLGRHRRFPRTEVERLREELFSGGG